MRRTVRRLAGAAITTALIVLGVVSPAYAVLKPHDPAPGAERVQVVTVEHTVEVPASDGPQYDQIAAAAVAGLCAGLLFGFARRRRTTDES